ncbi:putative ORFan, which is homologous to Satyrvirus sp [Cotonvirus japonicus]|uniref:ORFan, which is homologous to Satyrvirus sp n=1 Tax=Cotonvirus japonicus TaxID=2811091 RepID=A0ABM7NSI5_9VIRU|nr:putative ORFan, which is homologous to Satyrvirus sp [Cotonvirus japonicus]BCS83113.1 putative ORFan, which is homologous to Satyrvirus sp [Cotonvirus japonicus]
MSLKLFNGIFNDGGIENKIKILIDLNCCQKYATKIYINDEISEAIITPEIFDIDGYQFNIMVEQIKNETIIFGKEIPNIYYQFLPCVSKSHKYFVLTDKKYKFD